MSAAEIIEMIKKLPPEERAEVVAFAKNGGERTADAKGISDADFDRAADKVFRENRELLHRLAQ